MRLTILSSGEATRMNLLQAVRSVQPHVFHFVGHGLYQEDRREGALVLGEADGTWQPMSAQEVGVVLAGQGVQLAVLNACDTGDSGMNDAVTSVAGTLISQGVRASIATMRAVEDRAALMFTRNFYATLVEGEPMEGALSQARKALSLERWDWSLYALFASTSDLDRLALDVRRHGKE